MRSAVSATRGTAAHSTWVRLGGHLAHMSASTMRNSAIVPLCFMGKVPIIPKTLSPTENLVVAAIAAPSSFDLLPQ